MTFIQKGICNKTVATKQLEQMYEKYEKLLWKEHDLELNRNFYGFEINKEFYKRAKEEMRVLPKDNQISIDEYLAESEDKE